MTTPHGPTLPQRVLTLAWREWRQHRFGWALIALVPLLIALLALGLSPLEIDPETQRKLGFSLPLMMTMMTLVASIGGFFAIYWLIALIMASGIPRRDHGDRSIEFWLSMPVPHGASLGVPLVVHMLLVPLAALAVGLLSGLLISLVLVARTSGIGAWAGMPWALLLPAALAGVARLAVGTLLFAAWMAPLVMAVLLSTAWLKRWGVPVLVVAVVLVHLAGLRLTGEPVVGQALGALAHRAGNALIAFDGEEVTISSPQDVPDLLQNLVPLLGGDAQRALEAAFSLEMLIGLAVAAGLFVQLVRWRRQSAGLSG